MLTLLLSWCYNLIMVTIKTNEKEVRKALSKIPGAMQEATAAMLNVISTGAASRQKGNVQREMIVRGPYTLKSLVHYKASASKPIDRQNAIVGTKSPYLPIHDDGGKIRAKKNRIAVPTNKVRGADRKKRVAKKYRIDGGEVIAKRDKQGRMQPRGAKKFMLSPTQADPNDAKNYGGGAEIRKGKWKGLQRKIYGRKRGKKTVAYRLKYPAIFMRDGKKLVKIRAVKDKQYQIKANRWHSEAVERFGRAAMRKAVFYREAQRVLGKAFRK